LQNSRQQVTSGATSKCESFVVIWATASHEKIKNYKNVPTALTKYEIKIDKWGTECTFCPTSTIVKKVDKGKHLIFAYK
jgi:hypothetical protein